LAGRVTGQANTRLPAVPDVAEVRW
jgi:hypothetical protein